MYIITASFDVGQAQHRLTELLGMGDSPDRLAELLGAPRDLEMVRDGVRPASFKKMIEEIDRLAKFVDIEKQIEKLEADKSMLRFLGSGFKEKQLARLQEEKTKLGSLLDAPRWFYSQPRVRLLSAIRDAALDHSQNSEPTWSEVDEKSLVFPIVTIFEKADRDGAQIMVEEIEKPLQDINPRFLLESFEGHRSITFDLDQGVATYYVPTAEAAS